MTDPTLPVGQASNMPGTAGFTMVVFKSADIPAGTNLYTLPPMGEDPDINLIARVFAQFRQDACIQGNDRVDGAFIKAARRLMGAATASAQAGRIAELETMLSGERGLVEIWKQRASVWCLAADARAVHGSDLLEVLKELVKQHDEGFWSTWQTTAHFDAPLTAARAAIAKVDGAKP
jgi:hypothetical protein